MRFMDLVIKFFSIKDIWIEAVVTGTVLLLNLIELHISAIEWLFFGGLIFAQRPNLRFSLSQPVALATAIINNACT